MSEKDWIYTTNSKIPEGKSLPQGINRYAAVVSYDGSAFCGFQKQNHSPSVQQALEEALSYVANDEITVNCAGRTDTGVHASKQVIHFDTTAARNGRNWVLGANSQLPDNISLTWAGKVCPQFHARFSALSRTYRYVIATTPTRPAILAKGVTPVGRPLDIPAMQQACQYLIGEQDFSCFRAAGCQSLSPFRNVSHAEFYQQAQLVIFEITANAFVLHMVRNIVGALLEIGYGRQQPDWVKKLLEGKDRCKSAATAAPCGLYLVEVEYPGELNIPELPRGPLFLPEKMNSVSEF